MMDHQWLYIATSISSPVLYAPESLFALSNYQAGLYATDHAISMSPPSPSATSTASFSTAMTASSYSTVNSSYSFSRPLSTAPTTPISSPLTSAIPHEELRFHGPVTVLARLPSAQNINMNLLRSCAFLAGGQPVRALQAADIALKYAGDHGVEYLIFKSHLYRGLALMRLGRWKEAENELDKSGGLGPGGVVAMEERFREEGVEIMMDAEAIADLSEHETEQEVEKGSQFREKDVLWGVWPGDH